MAERPAPLSAAALRLAGHLGQTALDRVGTSGVAIVAELDQHVAAVKAELAACERPPATQAEPSGRASTDGNCSSCGARTARKGRLGRAARNSLRGGRATSPGQVSRSQDATAQGAAGAREATCPDVPFVATALHAEATVPLELLLHYACGFVQAALIDGWIPAASADAGDWVSLRLAAVCLLIKQTEAAAMAHPDLRPTAKPRGFEHEDFGAT